MAKQLCRLSDMELQEMEDKSTFGGLFQRGEVVRSSGSCTSKADAKPFPFQVKNDYKSEPPPAAPAKWDLNDPKVQEFLDIRPGPGGMQSC